MKRICIIILFLIIWFPSPSHSFDEWTKEDIITEAAYLSLKAVDWRQTRHIAKNPDRFYEMNPVLGRHPSTGEVDLYFLTTAIFHVGITHILPHEYDLLGFRLKPRRTFQYLFIELSLSCVLNNFTVGIKLDW